MPLLLRRKFLQFLSGFAVAEFALKGSKSIAPAAHAFGATHWRSGSVVHLLPTVSHNEILLKASFKAPLLTEPVLSIAGRNVSGQRSDTAGELWQFRVPDLEPETTYMIQIFNGNGDEKSALCDAWPLKTFPMPEAEPDHARILFFTCAGGREERGWLSVAARKRLFARALSFNPDAAIANGDHVYWDLTAPRTSGGFRMSGIGGDHDRSRSIFGTINETFLKTVAAPQIVPVYGTEFRSIPTFFIQDDHDYFDNDEATERRVTFPPDTFMTQMARATQTMYYPEFLPDKTRPDGLAGSTKDSEGRPISESFGTLRYGRLVELLLYTVRRTMTLAGPTAVFLEDTVEEWLIDRMNSADTVHLVNVPSTPFGWTAGKWGEWYPDYLTVEKNLAVKPPKPFWQSGWLKQHDRLLEAMSSMSQRIPITISGDLHASAYGTITRTGTIDLQSNPAKVFLCGTIGTGALGWPSRSRGVLPMPSLHLSMDEVIQPIEENGFTIADFTKDAIKVRMFKWNNKAQSVEEIDTLEPFFEITLKIPTPQN